MKAPFRIRKAGHKDIPELLMFKRQAIEANYSFLSVDERERWINQGVNEEYFQTMITSRDTILVIIESDELLGICAISQVREGLDKWAEVSNFFHTNSQAGRAILGACIAFAEGWKLPEIRCPIFIQDSEALQFFTGWSFGPSHHGPHKHLPEKHLLYLKRTVRGLKRDKATQELLQKQS